jgi:anti-sigma factor ChrR (cupin superfamily)
MTERPETTDMHLKLEELVGYVRGRLDPAVHARVEEHLAGCAGCREEVGDVVQLSRRAPSRTGASMLPAAAAAATILVLLWTGRKPSDSQPAETREQVVAAIAAPTPLAPAGAVPEGVEFRWRAAGGPRFRVVLFDSAGSVLFEQTTADDRIGLPDSVALLPGGLYLWKVEVETAADRWLSSDLVPFRPGRGPRR